jgi:hypothetical protein
LNAVEIADAISRLAEQPFEAAAFPYAFLEAFGNKETTIKRLKTGNTNQSDIEGGVLQRNHIHMAACATGEVPQTLEKLRTSPATTKQKARYLLATDGEEFQAEDLISGDTLACDYKDFSDHFGFFLPLAGISYTKEIKDVELDMKAARRLNQLYMTLLKDNPEWDKPERRRDMNHFMARLIFCFFAEDTDIFNGNGLFTATIQKMSDGSNAHEIISEIFRAMNIPTLHEGKPDNRYRKAEDVKSWADVFPYVNGNLFSGSTETPRFSKIARSYLLNVGRLEWQKINPDIFGSMIQAVTDEDKRGASGMHYTSVPNILKVLNPLFLDDLREQLEAAGDSSQKLLNLRKRVARIRVFDPACGSGNFLVIAYKEMRAIEAEINARRGEKGRKSDISIKNFRGIELHDFPAEVARLALIIAEYQCDVLYCGQKEALAAFLPLDAENWIINDNALKIDWLSVCPAFGKSVKLRGDDLFSTPLKQPEIDFDNEGGEIYVCGNPPYLGSTWQSDEQKAELKAIFDHRTKTWKSLDYVAGWFMKAADYGKYTNAVAAFVSTNSICQGQQVPILWPLIFKTGHEIAFAHTSFKWANLASNNAGVTVVIVGISNHAGKVRRLFSVADDSNSMAKDVENINAYLVAAQNIEIEKRSKPFEIVAEMTKGNQPTDGGHLLLTLDEVNSLGLNKTQHGYFIRRIYGSAEFIRGVERYCLWIEDKHLEEAMAIEGIRQRIEHVKSMRLASPKAATISAAAKPHRFGELRQTGKEAVTIVPSVSSEGREYLPVGYSQPGTIVSNLAFSLYDAPLWNMAIIASKLHLVWIKTVCGQLETRLRYSNTIGWNTFPVPPLTEKNKADLTRCAEDILLAREAHFPATIADLYDPEKMPENLRHAHERNDEVLERIYIGRRFKNDTERLEKLFDLYTKMTAKPTVADELKKKGAR